MKRGGPLKRTTPLKAKTGLKRTTRLRVRPKEPVSVGERLAMAAFGRPPRGTRCVVCGKTRGEAFRAGTKLEAHHVIPKERLKKIAASRGLDKITVVWDTRNRVFACGEPCHAQHTTRFKPIPFRVLPKHVFVFADEYGLRHMIERDYP